MKHDLGKAENLYYIVFELTWQWLQLKIYRMRGEPANHYTGVYIIYRKTFD